MTLKRAFLIAAILPLAACVEDTGSSTPTSAPAISSSSDLSSFEGARAGQAEMGIQNLGDELIRSEGLTSYWFNRESGACARITTANGIFSDVAMLPAADLLCGAAPFESQFS